ncbi:MAG TPA: dihydrodipicolinate reductase C-terminal domain-containing protein [Blastocatellia bacterium]|nr:dihydrodipicolinate reductase C-terminal domain-containing protein [Blastocatellia bacterium]
MKIAIVGYGKMGRMIERLAVARGHECLPLDIDDNAGGAALTPERLAGVEVAIEFSIPDAAAANIRRLVDCRVPVVVGTTGWYASLEEVKRYVTERDGTLVYGANFSIGVNIFFKIVREAAAIFSQYREYDPFLIESHHQFKKDAPSGTALVLANLMRESYGERTPEAVSVRAGYIPGTHEIGFDSEADTITLNHTARGREGFAAGALLAAELAVNRRGVFEFPELLFGSNHS